jgi:hypothetical protein
MFTRNSEPALDRSHIQSRLDDISKPCASSDLPVEPSASLANDPPAMDDPEADHCAHAVIISSGSIKPVLKAFASSTEGNVCPDADMMHLTTGSDFKSRNDDAEPHSS